MITKLILSRERSITIYTDTRRPGKKGGLRVEHNGASFYVPLSLKEQARLSYALADHRNRKSDEIKEVR